LPIDVENQRAARHRDDGEGFDGLAKLETILPAGRDTFFGGAWACAVSVRPLRPQTDQSGAP
jgi:hypothetical protein